VDAENVPCGTTGVTCTRSVTIRVGENTFQFLQGQSIILNGREVTLTQSPMQVVPGVYFLNHNIINYIVFVDLDIYLKADGGEGIDRERKRGEEGGREGEREGGREGGREGEGVKKHQGDINIKRGSGKGRQR
jgi:hypothetical protein